MLTDDTRATYLSLQSFLGRILFGISLYTASFVASDTASMSLPELRLVLGAYAMAGLLCFAVLAVTAKSALDPRG